MNHGIIYFKPWPILPALYIVGGHREGVRNCLWCAWGRAYERDRQGLRRWDEKDGRMVEWL